MRRVQLAVYVAAAVALLLCVSPAEARIEKLKIEADDRTVFHIESFGFLPGGKFTLTLHEFALWVKDKDQTERQTSFNIAFVLQHAAADTATTNLRIEEHGSAVGCFHENPAFKENSEVFLLSDRREWDKKVFKRDITEAGDYHLYFSNCEVDKRPYFEIELEEYNVDAAGNKVYLSSGEVHLPTWFLFMAVCFAVEALVWMKHVFANRPVARMIHHLMTAVVLFKTATLCFEAFEYYSIRNTGVPHGWQILFYLFSFLKGMSLFSVMVLISTGWSYLKPFLTERDKHIMLAVLVVQFMVNIAMVVQTEMSPGARQWLSWRDALHLLDMICWCAILVPIVWSVKQLSENAERDGQAARSVERLNRFRQFYFLVVAYIYFTRIIVLLMSNMLSFHLVWLAKVFEESANLIFYAVTGYLFRPQQQSPYFKDDEDEPRKAPALP